MENTYCDLLQLTSSMSKLVNDYKIYAQKVHNVPRPRVLSFETWKPPANGWIKLNFDAYMGVGCKRGLGIVSKMTRVVSFSWVLDKYTPIGP